MYMLNVQYSTSILNALLFIAAFYLLTACIKRNPGSILSSSSSLLGPWMQSGKKSCSLRQLRSIQITSSISFHYLHIHLRSYDPTILHSIALLHSLNSSFKLGNQSCVVRRHDDGAVPIRQAITTVNTPSSDWSESHATIKKTNNVIT